MHIIAVVRADTVFSRLVIKIELLVSISIFRGPRRCSRIFIKAVYCSNHLLEQHS